MSSRWDETWHRLREWTNGQAPSERLAAQLIIEAGYSNIDPSHPLGGKDGGKDAICTYKGERWVMAVYFPRGQKDFSEIRQKFEFDCVGATKNNASGIVFVSNQELRLSEREELRKASGKLKFDLFHLEKITTILDSPAMASVRHQFLGISSDQEESGAILRDEITKMEQRLVGIQTGGDAFCYLMLYYFDLTLQIAQNFVIIRKGNFPMYDVRLRILNMNNGHERKMQWGEISASAEYNIVKWPLKPSEYYRIFVHARNGQYHQDLQLKLSVSKECWLAATRVMGIDGATLRHEKIDDGFEEEFGPPEWRA